MSLSKIILPAGLVVGILSLTKKKSPQSSTSLPIILTGSTIVIKDKEKADNYVAKIAETYARNKIKDETKLSYVDLVGDLIKPLNKSAYDSYIKQNLTKEGTLITEYLKKLIENAFKVAYFGEMGKLGQDGEAYMSEDLFNDPDYVKFDNFINKINPAKTAEFDKYIGYDPAKMSNDLYNVTEIINKNGKYPVGK